MRWTRNLVVAFAVLFIGLFFTSVQIYLHAGSTPAMNLSANLATTEGSQVIPETAIIYQKEDRESFIAMMKNELSKRVNKIVVPAPVVTEVEEETESNDENSTSDEENREIVWCDATVLESQIAASWPKEVSVIESEGARLVVASTPVAQTASGTVNQSPITIMQFPTRPAQRSEPACLTNGYIGVTTDGRLIHNNDVILYTTYSESQLVGYAFDGNPIYGAVDSTRLDSCGGQNIASGYRYNLRSGENFILSCFMSDPQPVFLAG